MNRKMRTEILIRGPRDWRRQLADRVLACYPVEMVEAPHGGLVMVKVRETAQRSLFYLGEVYVTECKVRIQGCLGMGILKGDDGEGAYDLAVIDAAFHAKLPETLRWEALLHSLRSHLDAMEQQENQHILSTRVSFETMDV
jgi:alpha-D-ribose 1-methylphosphonate 5-triphosphate synthase subunit PhnG